MFVFILPHLLLWYRGWEIHGFAYSKYPRRPGPGGGPGWLGGLALSKASI